MSRTTLALLALVAAALSAGFALCMSIVHYSTWAFVPSSAFLAFQDASAICTVPTALALGIPSMALATAVAYRGVPGVTRWLLCTAAVLAVIPWVATPTVMIPLQFRRLPRVPRWDWCRSWYGRTSSSGHCHRSCRQGCFSWRLCDAIGAPFPIRLGCS